MIRNQKRRRKVFGVEQKKNNFFFFPSLLGFVTFLPLKNSILFFFFFSILKIQKFALSFKKEEKIIIIFTYIFKKLIKT